MGKGVASKVSANNRVSGGSGGNGVLVGVVVPVGGSEAVKEAVGVSVRLGSNVSEGVPLGYR